MAQTKTELRRRLKAMPRVATVLTDDVPPAGTTVMLFWPMPDEVDTRPFIRRCHEGGVRVVLPVVAGDDIVLRLYEGDESLRPGAFGILEPQGAAFRDTASISRIYVPGLAFTPDGRRMGRGRGYYDRFLARLEAEGVHPELVGVCPHGHLVDDLPTEPHDRRVHRVLHFSLMPLVCCLLSVVRLLPSLVCCLLSVVRFLPSLVCCLLSVVLLLGCKRTPPPDNPAFAHKMDTTGADDPYANDTTLNEEQIIRKVQDDWKRRQEIHRVVRAPYINTEKGIISPYDNLFKAAAAQTGWDWRLIAAQCYQESGFDPNARSGAGARGLMQLMPSTAEHYGLSKEEICQPEKNVGVAAQCLRALQRQFSDIRSPEERIHFVLASYNGGTGHVRDAMALCKKYGGNPQRWQDVSRYILALQQPQYYRDPVVKYGYMIGSETTGYVARVVARARQYGARLTAVSLPPGWKAFTLEGYTPPAASAELPGTSARKPATNRFTKGNSTVLRPEELERQGRPQAPGGESPSPVGKQPGEAAQKADNGK